jgi:hypothetical protein
VRIPENCGLAIAAASRSGKKDIKISAYALPKAGFYEFLQAVMA